MGVTIVKNGEKKIIPRVPLFSQNCLTVKTCPLTVIGLRDESLHLP